MAKTTEQEVLTTPAKAPEKTVEERLTALEAWVALNLQVLDKASRLVTGSGLVAPQK
jgi:uncharacterized coiled-coil protein SlyX